MTLYWLEGAATSQPILRGILSRGLRVRFHTPNGLHARGITEDLARLMRRAGVTTVRLSLESIDPVRQQTTGGKATTDAFARAISTCAPLTMDQESWEHMSWRGCQANRLRRWKTRSTMCIALVCRQNWRCSRRFRARQMVTAFYRQMQIHCCTTTRSIPIHRGPAICVDSNVSNRL